MSDEKRSPSKADELAAEAMAEFSREQHGGMIEPL